MGIMDSEKEHPPAEEAMPSGYGIESGENWGNYDDKDMARMGKKQELKRSFSWWNSVGFTSCTMGT